MIPSMEIMKTTSLYIETDSDVLFGKQENRRNIHINMIYLRTMFNFTKICNHSSILLRIIS